MKIAFIGTFNPVSLGHLLMAQTTLNKIEANKIVFVPVSDIYQKDELTTKAIYRIEMLKLATIGNNKFEVSNIEINFAQEKGEQPKTLETLFALKYQNHEEIGLLIGMDNFLDLHNWYHAEEMVKNFKMIVYPRLGFELDKTAQELYNKYPEQFLFVNTDLTTNISSTEIRKNFKEGKSNQYLLPERVLNYINSHFYYLDYCIDYKEK